MSHKAITVVPPPLPKSMMIDVESFKHAKWYGLCWAPWQRPKIDLYDNKKRQPLKDAFERIKARQAIEQVECERFWSEANEDDPLRIDADVDVARWQDILEYSKRYYAERRAVPKPELVSPARKATLPAPASAPMTFQEACRRHIRAGINILSADGERFIFGGGNREQELGYRMANVDVPAETLMSSIDRKYVEHLLADWRKVEPGYNSRPPPSDKVITDRLTLLEALLKVADLAPHGVLADGSNVAVKRSERWGLAAKRQR